MKKGLKMTSAIGLLLLCALSSCSVVMAAKKEGTSIDKVQACRTRGQFISRGAVVVSSERLPSGELVEVYQYKNETGSAARALMHGALDVGTCGLWEVVGTPIEVCSNDNTYFCVKVYYDQEEHVKRMELL